MLYFAYMYVPLLFHLTTVTSIHNLPFCQNKKQSQHPRYPSIEANAAIPRFQYIPFHD
jgi:hypothetical protein